MRDEKMEEARLQCIAHMMGMYMYTQTIYTGPFTYTYTHAMYTSHVPIYTTSFVHTHIHCDTYIQTHIVSTCMHSTVLA